MLFSPGLVSLKSDSRALMKVAGVDSGRSLTDTSTDTQWQRPVTSVDCATRGELPTKIQPRSVLTAYGSSSPPVMTCCGAKAVEQS